MYCPVCQNIPLDVCPTQACAQWRELIRLKLSQGQSAEEIKTYFAAQYGQQVLSEPPRQGLNWLIYILPPVSLLVGALIVMQVYRSTRRPVEKQRSQGPQGPEDPENDPYIQKLEEELKKRG